MCAAELVTFISLHIVTASPIRNNFGNYRQRLRGHIRVIRSSFWVALVGLAYSLHGRHSLCAARRIFTLDRVVTLV